MLGEDVTRLASCSSSSQQPLLLTAYRLLDAFILYHCLNMSHLTGIICVHPSAVGTGTYRHCCSAELAPTHSHM